MARTEITADQPGTAGATPTFTNAIADGHKFRFDHDTTLFFKNTDASPRTVTFLIPRTVDGIAVVNGGQQVVIPATAGQKVVRRLTEDYRQSDGMCYMDYSATTGLSVTIVD